MEQNKNRLLLPTIFLTASFIGMALCGLLTSPLGNVVNIMFFFIAMFVFLVSAGYLIAYVGRGIVSPKAKYRIIVFSLTTILILMFGSAQSLGLVDILILLLIGCGALFYGSKRVA
jgi:hypothetical protein